MHWSYGPNRYICSVLEEIRKCHETRNYSILVSLVEEAQTLANRMESALNDYGDYDRMLEERKDLKKELKQLNNKIKEAENGKSDK